MRILLLSCLLLLTMCKSQHYVSASRYAILNADGEYDHFKYGVFDNITNKPTSLSANEIDKIEKIIKTEVDKHNKKSSHHYSFIRNPRRYYKQLMAVINSRGEKEVWVNCFCNSDDKSLNDDNSYWKKGIVSVYDGGSCYFNLRINLTTNRVYDFRVNGVA